MEVARLGVKQSVGSAGRRSVVAWQLIRKRIKRAAVGIQHRRRESGAEIPLIIVGPRRGVKILEALVLGILAGTRSVLHTTRHARGRRLKGALR